MLFFNYYKFYSDKNTNDTYLYKVNCICQIICNKAPNIRVTNVQHAQIIIYTRAHFTLSS